jgi:hypothetical protein
VVEVFENLAPSQCYYCKFQYFLFQYILIILGVGKTELALKVLTEMRYQFDHILWINASTEQTMKQDLLLISNLLDLEASENNTLQVLIYKLYVHCNNYKCLFVFDNNVNHRYFSCNLLPPVGANKKNIYILVTSYYKLWDTDTSIDLKSFDAETSESFLKNNNKEITTEEASTITKLVDGLPFGLQIALSYIQHQNDLKYYDNEVYTIDDFINDNFTADVLQYKLDTNDRIKYTKSFSTLYNDLLKNISHESQGGLAVNTLPKLSLLYNKYIPLSLFKGRVEVATEDLALNEALITLQQYSMIDFENRLINISNLSQILIRKKYKDTLTFHIELVVKMILDRTITTLDEGTPILDDPVYLSSLWSAWGIWQSLENRPELPLRMSLVPYIIANSNLGRSEEIISYFDSCDAINLGELGWNNESYIGLKASLIRHHYKLQHYNKIIDLCLSAEINIKDTLKNTKPALQILHYKASSLQKLNKINEAFTLANDVLNRRLKYHSSTTYSYLKTFARMCSIVTQAYTNDPNTLLFPLWLQMFDTVIFNDVNYMKEKVQLIAGIQKYFQRLGSDHLITIYVQMNTYVRQKLAPPAVRRENNNNYIKYLIKIGKIKPGKGIYSSSEDEVSNEAFKIDSDPASDDSSSSDSEPAEQVPVNDAENDAHVQNVVENVQNVVDIIDNINVHNVEDENNAGALQNVVNIVEQVRGLIENHERFPNLQRIIQENIDDSDSDSDSSVFERQSLGSPRSPLVDNSSSDSSL